MKIAGCILAGGAGSRMGGQDKGLLLWRGQPLLTHVLARFAPQVDYLCLSANRSLARYQALGFPVFSDRNFRGGHPDLPLAITEPTARQDAPAPAQEPGFPGQGPLAGIERALYFAHQQHCALLAVVPCDAPLLPTTLVPRLQQALEREDADLAMACAQGREQPLFCLLRSGLHQDLIAYLRSQERKVLRWQERFSIARVCFDDEAEAFTNVNYPVQLSSADHTPDSRRKEGVGQTTPRTNG